MANLPKGEWMTNRQGKKEPKPQKRHNAFGIPTRRIILYPVCVIMGHRDVLCSEATPSFTRQGLLCKRCGRVKWL